MRKLIILRGAPGVGKSTFIKKQQLEGFALSPDVIRLMKGGIIMDPFGHIGINQKKDKEVWEEIARILDEKMARGEFIVIDATFQQLRDFTLPLKLASLHRYDILCIDFSSVPLERALQQNMQRELYKQLPEALIKKAYENLVENPIPQRIKTLSYKDFEHSSLIKSLNVASVNLNAYKKIHHIGDIQGCFEPVTQYFSSGFKEDEFYIFVGDFLDRGIQNGEVIRWLVDHVIKHPNVVLLWGNHETHIHRYATKQPCQSEEFAFNTLPQLKASGFTEEEASRLCNRLVDCFVYHYGKIKCLVSHAGIAKVAEDLVLLPSHQFWKGTGDYHSDIDQMFSDNMSSTEWIQIHGHRNSKNLPIKASEKSFNLEGKVEFGGHLRIATLSPEAHIDKIEIRNSIFRDMAASTPKAYKEDEKSKISPQTLEKLGMHDFIHCKKFSSFPHITSYNFSREAFSKNIWDETTLSARGLFIDDHRSIVVRSYNKFFNIEEKAETGLKYLKENIVFPLTLYIKENGFLGLLGYDTIKDQLFFTSKSTPESSFAQWFKEILQQKIDASFIKYMKNMLRDKNISLVFEVNDPVNDPHIIEYDTRHVVLLDAIHRTEAFSRLSYPTLEEYGRMYGLVVKKKAITFKNWNAFQGWHDNMEKLQHTYRFKDRYIEGFVAEDMTGFMFKIKSPYYNFWKYMRSVKERVLIIRKTKGALQRNISSPEASAFYHWALAQSDKMLEKDIITLRKSFLA